MSLLVLKLPGQYSGGNKKMRALIFSKYRVGSRQMAAGMSGSGGWFDCALWWGGYTEELLADEGLEAKGYAYHEMMVGSSTS
jgi:hypothetical protein